MSNGYLGIVLHAHLPYVRHPEYEQFFEESWLFQAITESYIPLIQMLDRLLQDQVSYRLTLSLSPTLLSMLNDELLKSRYLIYLNARIELAEKEIIRTRQQPAYQRLARLYRRFFKQAKQTYLDYQTDLIAAFLKHYHAGGLTLITTSATHAILPLLNVSETAVRNQIKVGIDTFQASMGFSPNGFWLPECGYYPGLETLLEEVNIGYFFVDSHAVNSMGSSHNVYAPVDCGNGVMAFARDPETSQQVWSADYGFPGHEDYREYYSDIGFELAYEYIQPYLLDKNNRTNTGIKYHRVNDNHQNLKVYDPRKAQLKVLEDASDFIQQRQNQLGELTKQMAQKPFIVAPYDAELFGHWWSEGVMWLEAMIRKTDQSESQVKLISCEDYLLTNHKAPIQSPSFSTWGEGGYSSYWINETNDWIYPYLLQMEQQMEQLAADLMRVEILPLQKRALNQAARTLLLAQASDWPFLLKAGRSEAFAKQVMKDYFARFNYLHETIRKNAIDERYLTALETMDNIFPEIDFSLYNDH